MPTDGIALVLRAGHRVACVGGGRIAARKLRGLLGRAAVVVIAPTVTEEIAAWAEQGRLRHEAREFRATDIHAGDLVILAAPAAAVAVRTAAREQGAWLNDAIEATAGEVHLPAVWSTGGLAGTIATGNASPRLAKLLKNDLATEYAALGAALPELAVLRRRVKELVPDGRAREAFWRQHLPDDAVARIRRGEWGNMKGEIEDAISRLGSEP